MNWPCRLCACLIGLQTSAFAAGPTTAPTSRPDGLAPLETTLPRQGFDGDWMCFERWRRDRPDAEDCTGPLAPFLVPRGTRNLALHRPVTSSDKEPLIGTLDLVTDGNKDGNDGEWVELETGLQWVQIDLGRPCRLYAVLVWHNTTWPGLHKDVLVQVSDDERFINGVQTLFNNDRDNSSGLGRGADREYFEALGTKIINAKGLTARYVRLYSNGRIQDDWNHYVEVEVHGLPAAEDLERKQ